MSLLFDQQMMAAFLEEFRHLEEIKLATKNFEDTNVIESGGCGNMYKEFMMVSHYTHETLVSLRNFVAMIMRRSSFMRYYGSLDSHLRVGALTRPEISVGVACGLNYIHNKKGDTT